MIADSYKQKSLIGKVEFVKKTIQSINILKTELEKKVIKLAYMKIDVGDVEFKNAITYPVSE